MPEHASLISLDTIVNGAVTERLNHALAEVIANMLDLNTDFKKARKITVSIAAVPNEQRDMAAFAIEVKASLVPRKHISTQVLFGVDADGQYVTREVTREIPGQMDMDGGEVVPKELKLAPPVALK